MIESLFKVYSVGQAGENRPITTWDLNVFPIERIPYANGELTAETDTLTADGEDYFGQKYSVKVELSNCLVATWLPFGSNRTTPPNIRRGERVFIWRYADVDQYYWSDSGLDGFLRRLETVIYAWSDTKDETVKALSPDNSYYFEVSTHQGLVTFATCKSNGEPFAYTIQINTADGTLTVTDDNGNYIDMNSGEKLIRLENGDETHLYLDKTNMYGFAKETIQFDCKDYIVNAERSVSINTTTYALDAKTSVDISTVTFTTEATGTTTFTTPEANFSAKVNVGGLLTLAAGLAATAGGGTASFSIPITSDKDISTSSDVKVGGVTLTTHVHTDPQGGKVGPAIAPSGT